MAWPAAVQSETWSQVMHGGAGHQPELVWYGLAGSEGPVHNALHATAAVTAAGPAFYLVELCQVRPVHCLVPEHTVDGEELGRPEALLQYRHALAQAPWHTELPFQALVRVLSGVRAATACHGCVLLWR